MFFNFSAFQTEGKLYLILEFLRGGDLFTRLSKEVGYITHIIDVFFFISSDNIVILLSMNTSDVYPITIHRNISPMNTHNICFMHNSS